MNMIDFLWVFERAINVVFEERVLIAFSMGIVLLTSLMTLERKRLAAIAIILLSIPWIFYSGSILGWLGSLGVDSLSEAQNFDFSEAYFFILSGLEILQPIGIKKAIFIFLIGVFLALLVHVIFLKFRYINFLNIYHMSSKRFILITAIACVTLPIAFNFFEVFKNFEYNSNHYANVDKNFHEHRAINLAKNINSKELELLVYIGESTSVMNMGIYGYPRATTPLVERFQLSNIGFMAFDNVFSTHSHTSASLLEALSVAVKPEDDFLPIYERRRTSIVDLLNQIEVPSYLWSNQGMSGTSNIASSIIFRNAANRNHSSDSSLWGGVDTNSERLFDDVYFAGSRKSNMTNFSGSSVTFLHSYAGHGPYALNIPERFRRNVDDFFLEFKDSAVIGNREEVAGILNNIEGYDSAVQYIDFNINNELERIQKIKKPSVLIYFSDHGESVYTGRGHDSSRFLHEMIRVPFFIYFNDAARLAFSDEFKEFKSLEERRNVSTLAQLPSTILYLLGYESPDKKLPIGFFTPQQPPVLIRKLKQGYSRLPLSNPEADNVAFLDGISTYDSATTIFIAQQALEKSGTKLCQHRANSIGTALRGALIANCLETDLMIDDDGMNVYHPPADPTGLDFRVISNIAERHGLALWVDGKNLGQPKRCERLYKFFVNETDWRGSDVLIEFPSDVNYRDKDIRSCLKSLILKGYKTSYYVPSDIVASCASTRSEWSHDEDIGTTECQNMKNVLDEIAVSGLFTDFSFVYSAVDVMEKFTSKYDLNWNTWGVDPRQLLDIDPTRFKMIIPSASDPNFN